MPRHKEDWKDGFAYARIIVLVALGYNSTKKIDELNNKLGYKFLPIPTFSILKDKIPVGSKKGETFRESEILVEPKKILNEIEKKNKKLKVWEYVYSIDWFKLKEVIRNILIDDIRGYINKANETANKFQLSDDDKKDEKEKILNTLFFDKIPEDFDDESIKSAKWYIDNKTFIKQFRNSSLPNNIARLRAYETRINNIFDSMNITVFESFMFDIFNEIFKRMVLLDERKGLRDIICGEFMRIFLDVATSKNKLLPKNPDNIFNQFLEISEIYTYTKISGDFLL
jgi:hypothetical protein